ncbi:MAG: SUMF1/EgtB/PvdO family nonheme iron enzyme, partial [Desulfobacteraceae bacterium]
MKVFPLVVILTLLITACATDTPNELKDEPENSDDDSTGHPFFVIDDLNMKFISIPAGTFLMGSPADELGREHVVENQYTVTLTKDFYIQTTEVTRGQWRAVVEA